MIHHNSIINKVKLIRKNKTKIRKNVNNKLKGGVS